MGDLPKDTRSITMQLFKPERIEAVVQDVAWTPGVGDRAFRVPTDVNYQMNGGGGQASIMSGSITGIVADTTYTFSASMNIEVM